MKDVVTRDRLRGAGNKH